MHLRLYQGVQKEGGQCCYHTCTRTPRTSRPHLTSLTASARARTALASARCSRPGTGSGAKLRRPTKRALLQTVVVMIQSPNGGRRLQVLLTATHAHYPRPLTLTPHPHPNPNPHPNPHQHPVRQIPRSGASPRPAGRSNTLSLSIQRSRAKVPSPHAAFTYPRPSVCPSPRHLPTSVSCTHTTPTHNDRTLQPPRHQYPSSTTCDARFCRKPRRIHLRRFAVVNHSTKRPTTLAISISVSSVGGRPWPLTIATSACPTSHVSGWQSKMGLAQRVRRCGR